MDVQPFDGSITLMQPQAMTPVIEKKPKKVAKKQSGRAEAVRMAKAKISRRRSLSKQREALKD